MMVMGESSHKRMSYLLPKARHEVTTFTLPQTISDKSFISKSNPIQLENAGLNDGKTIQT
jgi:hypothetical protein